MVVGVEYEDSERLDVVVSGRSSCVSSLWGIGDEMFEADGMLPSFLTWVTEGSMGDIGVIRCSGGQGYRSSFL